jgi:hypothetical protein
MKFENTQVSNFSGALRGMRNPLASWDKNDSFFGVVNFEQYESIITSMSKKWADKKICGYNNYNDHSENISGEEMYDYYIETSCENLKKNGILQGGGNEKNDFPFEVALIGPNDMKLAQKLISAGPEHRKFLRQIFVSVDITAPLYWWK